MTVAWEMAAASHRVQQLLDRAREVLSSHPVEVVSRLAPEVAAGAQRSVGQVRGQADDQELTLAFGGQFEAGKSTLISALTGDSLRTGVGVTTMEPERWPWRGLVLIDTPGLQSGTRPDHDEISAQALATADLVVWVISNELMDPTIAEGFRRLAVDQGRAACMLLVINKMDREAGGDTPDKREILERGLSAAVSPLRVGDLRVCFTSAERALRAVRQTDPRRRDRLIERSGMPELAAGLDELARERGLRARIRLPLVSLNHLLERACAAGAEHGGDTSDLLTTLLEERGVLQQSAENLRQSSRSLVRTAGGHVRGMGREIADDADTRTREQYDSRLAEASRDIDETASKLDSDFADLLRETLGRLEEDLQGLGRRQQTEALADRIIPRIDQLRSEAGGDRKRDAGLWGIAKELGDAVAGAGHQAAAGAALGDLLNLRNAAGTPMHQAVKNIGRLCGKKFRPWEAVRITRNVKLVGRSVAVVAAVANAYFVFADQLDAIAAEDARRENRRQLYSGFDAVAVELESHYGSRSEVFVSEVVDPQVKRIDLLLAAARDTEASKSTADRALAKLKADVELALQEIV